MFAGSPFLTRLSFGGASRADEEYPFNLPFLRDHFELHLTTPVTFFVGENGSGKSTLLEALAWNAGFNAQGGSRDNQFTESTDGHALGRKLSLSWSQRTTEGFFLRAETFFNFASHLEDVGSLFTRYGGQSLHTKSHGEAFLALFENRFEDGLFLLDEPEAALSPQRQLTLLSIMHSLTSNLGAQFIIATHSPILMAFPGATILNFDGEEVREVDYRDTDHFKITRDFLDAPERFFRHLFVSDDDDVE